MYTINMMIANNLIISLTANDLGKGLARSDGSSDQRERT